MSQRHSSMVDLTSTQLAAILRRAGQDILKSVALGADATLTGRAFLYGLGAAGQAGVTKALEIMHKELDMSMALCGHRDILNVDRNILKNCPF